MLSAMALILIGFLFIWSAKSLSSAKDQLMTAAVGMGFVILLAVIDYRRLMPWVYLLYALGLLSLLMLPVFGVIINGSRRWYKIGPIMIQPSEFMKPLAILALAKYYCYRRGEKSFGTLLIPLGLVLVPMALIAKQPDLGTSLTFLPLFFCISYAAGTRVRNLALIIFLGASIGLFAYFTPGIMKDYQKRRVISFLYPDAPGNLDASYNVRQALVAVANGGVFGEGWGHGTLNRLNRLPMKYADFIFAVVAEELGFLQTSGFILLYLFFIGCIWRVSVVQREPFGKWIATGVMAWFGVQTFLHSAMSLRLVPVAGMPLPFISYGRSAMLAGMFALALVVSVSTHRHDVFSQADLEDQ